MSYNPFSLEGKTVLVTGASSGIGKSAAIECSKMGARVVITARDETRLLQTYHELEGNNHQMILCDLSQEESIDLMVSDIPEVQGLINNAGFTKILPIPFINSDELNAIFKVDTFAPILLLQKMLKKKKLLRKY